MLSLVAYSLKPAFRPMQTDATLLAKKKPNNTQQCCDLLRPFAGALSVYTNQVISSYRRHLRQIATAAFNLRTWDSDTRIGIGVNISSATESNRIAASRLKTNYLDISNCALLHVLK